MKNKCIQAISLDVSTTTLGWAKWDVETAKLLAFGAISPKLKGGDKLLYPERQVRKIRVLIKEVLDLVRGADLVIIEEVNRGKARISQKILCGCHFMLLDKLIDFPITIVHIDSDGKTGWRSKAGLGLQLSPADKLRNAEIRKMNRRLKKKDQKKLINLKQLACDFVNKQFGLNLDVRQNDISDAIGLGFCYLTKVLGKTHV